MLALIPIFLCSFAVSLLLTPLLRNLALRLGIVDRPSEARKIHDRPIARIGGIPILLACGAGIGLWFLMGSGSEAGAPGMPLFIRLIPAVSLIFLVGLWDDIAGLRPWQKLAGEVAAAGAACAAGITVQSIAGFRPGDVWAIPLTILWLVGCTNALNLIDGVDGLATGVALFAALTTLVAGLLHGNVALALATVPLVGALLGFLRYNFNPASIFLGDCGSLTLGFLLGCYGVIWSQKAATVLGMTAPLMALSIPLLDTAISIARRFMTGKPIFGADRRHIHHLLLDRGLTPRRVALMLYGMCGIAATFSLVQSVVHQSYSGAVIVLFCAAAWMGIQHLGYVEFDLAGRLIRRGTFRKVLDAQVRLHVLEKEIEAAGSVDECWQVIRESCPGLGFSCVRLHLRSWKFSDGWDESARKRTWTVRVPLSGEESIEFGRAYDEPGQPEPVVVGSLAKILRQTLAPKLTVLQAAASNPRHNPKHSIEADPSPDARAVIVITK